MAKFKGKTGRRGQRAPNVYAWLAAVVALLVANVALFAARYQRMTIDWSARKLRKALIDKNKTKAIAACAELLAKMDQRDPRRAIPLIVAASIRLKNGEFRRAQSSLGKALSVLRKSPRRGEVPTWGRKRCMAIIQLELGVCDIQGHPAADRFDKALDYFKAAGGLDDDLSDVWIAEAIALISKEDWNGAKTRLSRGVNEASSWVEYRPKKGKGPSIRLSKAPSP